ncbi:MAG TPA: TolC family protein [Gemmataceae bacterium]|jgi:hypothetical protein|nr:TolC family protein [Gemmataceae bacterium]
MRVSMRQVSARLLCAASLAVTAGTAAAQPAATPAAPPKASPYAPATPAQPAPLPEPAPARMPGAEAYQRYTLAEALSIGHQRHPQLGALRASMNAALLKQRGIGEVKKSGGFLLPDIDQRTQQGDLGLQAAVAEYQQAEHEVTYAVVRCYYTVVYAREQNKVAKDLVEQLETYLEQVRRIVNSKEGAVKGINKDTEQNLVNVLSMAKGRLIDAETGTERARAALRESLGLEPGAKVDAADELLPEVSAELKRDTVIAHAVSRRGEVALAAIGADVTRLEVLAQQANRLSIRVPTYANAGDIHARPIPPAQREPDYKPGAIGPEMPDKIVGKVHTRTAIAAQYAERAEEAARQARSLVGLEAEVGYTRYVEAAAKVKNYKFAAAQSKEMIERQREAAGGNLTKEGILTIEVSAAQTYANYNQALYDQLVALANLERITAGGVRVNFPGR